MELASQAEEYIDALVEVISYLNVDRFCRIGAMYDAVPHTRPLLVMGTLNGQPIEDVEGIEGNRRRPYQGPTSIMNMVGDRISESGVDNMMLMCRLPHYVELEADFAGRTKMLQVLSTLYGFPAEYAASQRDTQQYARSFSCDTPGTRAFYVGLFLRQRPRPHRRPSLGGDHHHVARRRQPVEEQAGPAGEFQLTLSISSPTFRSRLRSTRR